MLKYFFFNNYIALLEYIREPFFVFSCPEIFKAYYKIPKSPFKYH